MGTLGVRSPEELRAFYTIALQAKNLTTGGRSGCDTHSISSRSSSSTASTQSQSGSSVSLFSTGTQTASSATSISEDKAPATSITSPRTDRSCMPDVHPNASEFYLVLGGEETDVSFESCHVESTIARVSDDVHEELSALRNLGLNLSCQQCRIHKLGCDKASPSCWNCVQTYRQCYYGWNEASNTEEIPDPPEVSAEEISQPPSWGDTLRDHPYYSLEGSGKLGRVGMWSLKLRHDLPLKPASSKSRPVVEKERFPEDDEKLLLMRRSPVPFADGNLSLMEDVMDDASSIVSSPSTCILSSSWSLSRTSYDSGLTISLDLGAVSNLALPSLSNKELVSASSDCSSLASSEEDGGDILDDFCTNLRAANTKYCPSISSGLFYCIFCLQHLDGIDEWENHEKSEHFNAQKDWICMPWGAIEELENGEDVCAFCGTADPDSSHGSKHRDEPCMDRSVGERTYKCREDFQEHLWNDHNEQTITIWMESWSYPPKDDSWYWECGFCDRLLGRWSDRVTHIGNHFKTGISMSRWNPLVPPYPIDKSTGTHINWFSSLQWDPGALLALQLGQHEQSHSSHPVSEKQQCHHCDLDFRNEADTKRHKEVWHSPHNVWSCPTMDDIRTATSLQTGPLSWYLFQETSLPTACEEDVCPYCGDPSEIIFEDYGEDIVECFADWDIRIKHLKDEHKIDKCHPGLKFDRADQFLLHLAGSHNVRLTDWTKEVIDSCKRREQVLL